MPTVPAQSVRIFSIPHGERKLMVDVGRRSDGSINAQPVTIPADKDLVRPFSTFRTGNTINVVLKRTEAGVPYLALAEEYLVPRVDVQEDQTHEFKMSMFVAPREHEPSERQMQTIAQTVASFMNADGGTLYIGVEDKSGRIDGCKRDLETFRCGVPAVIGFSDNDARRTYNGSMDHYRMKFKAIVSGYLEPDALQYLGDMEEIPCRDTSYLKIDIKPAPEGKLVYFWRKEIQKDAEGNPTDVVKYVADLYARIDNEKKNLRGKARDEFVMRRQGRYFRKQIENLQSATTGVSAAELAEQLKELLKEPVPPVATHRAGYVSAFSEAAIADISGVSVLYFKEGTDNEKSVRLGKSTYQELYVALLKIFNELDSQKFQSLSEEKAFFPQRRGAPPNFAQRAAGRGAGVRMRNASEYIGTVRANLQGFGKMTFFDPRKLPLRLMTHFGVSLADFSVGK